MATNPDQEEFLEDDEQDEIARRSIFSAGWFRALLVLTVLAIVVVVSLPYLLNWLEPTPPPTAKSQVKSAAPAPRPTGAPPTTSAPAPALVPAPAAPTKAEAPTPSAQSAKMAEQKSAQPAPAPAAPSPADRPVGSAPLPAVPAPPAPAGKSAPGSKSVAAGKAAPAGPATTPAAPAAQAAKSAPTAQAVAPKPAPASKRGGAVVGGSPGGYWVQVGAFLEEKNAETLARQIRGENFPVQVSTVTRGGAAPAAPAEVSGGQNQLFITGSTPDAVNAALKGKGTAQAVKGGVQVDPSFDLETAMSLSSALKKDGFKVVIRRTKGGATPKAVAGGGQTYHLVRVGGYPDRAKAQQARGELEAKGHRGFLTEGAAR